MSAVNQFPSFVLTIRNQSYDEIDSSKNFNLSAVDKYIHFTGNVQGLGVVIVASFAAAGAKYIFLANDDIDDIIAMDQMMARDFPDINFHTFLTNFSASSDIRGLIEAI